MRVNVSSAAVFGSYLRPDLVPANPSFYEGSSMGTISTSSIFVNLDNQTEERYCLFSLCTRSYCCHYSVTPCWLSAGKNKYFITLKQWCKVPVHNTTLRAGREASRLATPNTHSHAITTFALTSHGLLGDMRHRAGDSSLLGNTRAVYTRTLPTQHTDGTVKGWEVRWWELSLSFIYETQK